MKPSPIGLTPRRFFHPDKPIPDKTRSGKSSVVALLLTVAEGSWRQGTWKNLYIRIFQVIISLAIVGVCMLSGCISGVTAAAAPPVQIPPKYGPAAVPVFHENVYLRNPAHPAPDYWALSPFYVPQRNEYECSVASVAAVVNALTRANRELDGSIRNVTAASLLETVAVAQWAQRVQKGGFNGQVGLTLEQLAEALGEALRLQGIANHRIETVQVTADDQATRDRWRAALAANETSADDMLLIHFTQDTLTGSGGGPYPHISPIGAFDAGADRALALDVDREYYEPYWSPTDMIVKAMAVSTPQYGYGGWLRVIR